LMSGRISSPNPSIRPPFRIENRQRTWKKYRLELHFGQKRALKNY